MLAPHAILNHLEFNPRCSGYLPLYKERKTKGQLWPVAAGTSLLHLQPGDAVFPHHDGGTARVLPASGERREDLARHHRAPLALCLPAHGLREHAGHVRDRAAHWCVQSRVYVISTLVALSVSSLHYFYVEYVHTMSDCRS